MSYLSEMELRALGLAKCGVNVRISRKVSIYNPGNISVGSNVRIDDFCVLSAGEGGIEIGDYVHVAVYCSLIGSGRIQLANFSGLSSRVAIYSSNEDYSGAFLTNPTVPQEFKRVTSSPVTIGRHAIIGAGSVVLPGVELGEGVSVGALSLVNKDCTPFGVYFGAPARRIAERRRDLLVLEQTLGQAMTERGTGKI